MSGTRRLGWIHWAVAAGAVCAYWACKDDETRPGTVADCGDDCSGGPIPILNPGVDVPGMGGSAGAGGSGGGGGSAGSAGSSSMGATLSGSIQALSATLEEDRDLNGTVKVQAPGVDMDQVSVDSEPSGDFRLIGVSSTLPLWVGIGPFNGDPASTFMDTLQRIDSPLALPVDLVVMRRTVFEEIVGTGFLNAPEVDATRGHVILRFIDAQRQGIAGAFLESPPPMTTTVAYDADDIYSDQATATDLRGTMVLLNLPSNPYPGEASTIGVRVFGTRHDVDVRIANGAITVVTTVVPRP